MFTRIVVAYDHSPGARRALAEALALARPHPESGQSVELIAIAVQEHLPNYAGAPEFAGIHEEIGEGHGPHLIEDQACQRWLHAAAAAATGQDITLITEVRTGHVAQELIGAAVQHQADLIVLGNSGHSAAWGPFLGTTTEKVSRHVQCSVLIVR